MDYCARPGCGHSWASHCKVMPDGGSQGCAYVHYQRRGMGMQIEVDEFCDNCPSYRTPEQQEAWEALRDNIAGVTSEWDSPKIIRRLLELYP
jgi:hypothetical protein